MLRQHFPFHNTYHYIPQLKKKMLIHKRRNNPNYRPKTQVTVWEIIDIVKTIIYLEWEDGVCEKISDVQKLGAASYIYVLVICQSK